MKYDVISPRKYQQGGEEKTAWIHVGVAFDDDKSGGVNIMLHAIPVASEDGAIRLMVRKPREKE